MPADPCLHSLLQHLFAVLERPGFCRPSPNYSCIDRMNLIPGTKSSATGPVIRKKKAIPPPPLFSDPVPWIQRAPEAPYFIMETGADWTPIGQNDAISWPDLQGAFRRKDLDAVENHLRWLKGHGITCLRLMLEYCQGESRYFEKPVGRFVPNMIQLWDDLFALCGKHGLRILLTPYDTFWMWIRWGKHPYKKSNGGPCARRNEWLTNAATRKAIKDRLAFATARWGGSGTLFAWDIWNEIHPAHSGDQVAPFAEFIEDISSFLRETELRLHGRAHPQTVSLFGPVLLKYPEAAEAIFRHPALDFASTHFYEAGTIDYPRNTVDAAVSTGRLTRDALAHIRDNRPFFDSEHGPIHLFKDRKRTLPEPFDDEYFRHMQWAHLASGGAGGGMRWPNRHPHVLTHGMRKAQQSMSRFLPLIDWQHFQRHNLNEKITVSDPSIAVFGCGSATQAVVWLLRTNQLTDKGMLRQAAPGITLQVQVPGLQQGTYQITAWDTAAGTEIATFGARCQQAAACLCWQTPPVATDMAFAIRYTG